MTDAHLLEYKEEAAGEDDQDEGERQDAALSCDNYPSIAEEAVLSRENFPLPTRSARVAGTWAPL